MTTIAWDGHTIAADSAASAGNRTVSVCKLWKLSDGRVVGGAGTLADVIAAVDWLASGSQKKLKPAVDADSSLLVVTPQGRCFEYGSDLRPIELLDTHTAIGSGSDYALGAMAAGKTAEQAVAIACLYDPFSAGDVVSFPAPRRGRRKL